MPLHVGLETTSGPPSTTQRLLRSILRACIVPYGSLKTTQNPLGSSTTQRLLSRLLRACIVPHWSLSTKDHA